MTQKSSQHIGAIQRLVDIQAKLKASKGPGYKGPGYEHWAKIFNLKEMARTMDFLSERGISDMGQLRNRVMELRHSFADGLEQMKTVDKRLNEIAALRKNYSDYLKTKPVYDAFRKSKQPETYRTTHEADLLIFKAARCNLAALHLKQHPNMEALQMEYTELAAKRKNLYVEYRQTKEKMLEWQTVQSNVGRMFRKSEKARENQRSGDIER